ncbi:MAG: ABC transporter ATP-binding protein, partial [Pseudomonadota bacterium]
ICGRLRPKAGQINVCGHDPRTHAHSRRCLGLVPQQIALYPHLSVLENLQAFARLAGVPRSDADARARHSLAQCALETVANQRVDQLSGGWQRRANIACGVVHRPQVLVLDEPTVGIDLPARLDIERLLSRLSDDGMTILLTSHDLEQVERLADRVGFLINGLIEPVGPPRRLLDRQFADCYEWRIQLDQTPSSSDIEHLTELGLKPEPAAGQLHWCGRVRSDREASDRMQRMGAIGVREWRVRQPGLDSLWRELFDDSVSEAMAVDSMGPSN